MYVWEFLDIYIDPLGALLGQLNFISTCIALGININIELKSILGSVEIGKLISRLGRERKRDYDSEVTF